MSQQPEMRFVCDRCGVETTAVLETRQKPPLDWMTLWVDEITKPALHLCPGCAPKFQGFMEGREPDGS